MNKIVLTGHLGRDPETNYKESGNAVTKFTFAVTRVERNASGEKTKETDWYNVIAWGKQAETLNAHCRKGSKLYLEGRFVPRKYKDRGGVERISLDVKLSDFELLSPKDKSQSEEEEVDVDALMKELDEAEHKQ